MKKRFSIFSVMLCVMLACCIITGCTGNLKYYNITVKSSHYNLGAVEGGNGDFEEGTNITIKAIPVQTTVNSGFYCWLFNDKVLTTTPEYSIEVSDKTAGEYVAIFKSAFMEYFSLESLSFDSGIDANNSSTYVKQIELYLGNVENNLTNIYTLTEVTGTQTNLSSADIYRDDELPYAYDMQEDLFIEIVITYVQDEVEFVTSTKAKIDATNNIEEEVRELKDTENSTEEETKGIVLSDAVNPENEDMKLNLNGNKARFGFKMTRLSTFNLPTEGEKEE